VNHNVKVGLTLTFNGLTYKLIAFTTHKGYTMDVGHYTSYLLCKEREWFLLDDDIPPKLITKEELEFSANQGYYYLFHRVNDI
jgi:uncharacterized UBP type Zn finger protein